MYALLNGYNKYMHTHIYILCVVNSFAMFGRNMRLKICNCYKHSCVVGVEKTLLQELIEILKLTEDFLVNMLSQDIVS